MEALFLGYAVEKLEETPDARGRLPAYRLRGKRAVYTLWRNPNRTLYATNSAGNVCGLKGNYTFADGGGTLRCFYPWEKP
jgi:hypothetical protein